MKRLALIVFLMIVLITMAAAAQADTIETRNGKIWHGEYMGGTYATLRFKTEGRMQIFQTDEVSVLVLERGDGGAEITRAAPRQSGLVTETIQPQQPAATGKGYGVQSYNDHGRAGVSAGADADSATATITIPPGRTLRVRLTQAVSTGRNGIGDRFMAVMEHDISVLNMPLVPRGTKTYGRVVSIRRAQRRTGNAEMTIELTDIKLGDRPTSIVTDRMGLTTGPQGELQTSGGSGITSGSVSVTPGRQIMLNSGAILEFVLRQPLVFQAR